MAYDHDLITGHGKIRKRNKGASRQPPERGRIGGWRGLTVTVRRIIRCCCLDG